MSKIFTYIIHSFVPQIFIEHDKGGLYDMQGSIQGETAGALVQKQEDFYFLLWLLSPPSWYLFYLLFNVAFLKQRHTSSTSTDHCKCPVPHPGVIEAAWVRSHYSAAVIARLEVPLCQQWAWKWSSWQRVGWEVDISLLPWALQALWCQASLWTSGAGYRLRAVSCRGPELSPQLPLGRHRPWSNSEPLPHPHLQDIMVAAAAVSMVCSPWRPR